MIFLNAENEVFNISETVRDRTISTKIFYPRVSQSVLATFPKNHFPATFGAHLEFLRKTQKHLSRKRCEIQ